MLKIGCRARISASIQNVVFETIKNSEEKKFCFVDNYFLIVDTKVSHYKTICKQLFTFVCLGFRWYRSISFLKYSPIHETRDPFCSFIFFRTLILRSATTYNYHQHISSPTSITNINVTYICRSKSIPRARREIFENARFLSKFVLFV